MKDLIILCAGSSIEKLANKIELFSGLDVPYVSINGYEKVIKDTFLKLGRYPDYATVYASGDWRMPDEMLSTCLQNGMTIVTHEASYTEAVRKKFPSYTVFNPDVDRDKPENHTNSLFKVLAHFKFLGYDRFFVYGCDGYGGTGEIYYKPQSSKPNEIENKLRDTKDINERMWQVLHEYGCYPLEVYNCNPESYIRCFPRITVEKSVEMLNGL